MIKRNIKSSDLVIDYMRYKFDYRTNEYSKNVKSYYNKIP